MKCAGEGDANGMNGQAATRMDKTGSRITAEENPSSGYGEWKKVQHARRRQSRMTRGNFENSPETTVSELGVGDQGISA